MEFVLAIDEDRYEVRLVGDHPALTVGEALGRTGSGAVTVDGHGVAIDRRFAASVRPGSVVGSGPPSRSAVAGGPPAAPGRRPFNRPPRGEFPVALPPIPAPLAREAPRSTFRFGWAALVVPVVLGVILAIAIHPRMALFAVFSPAMAFSNWIEDRRRTRKGAQRNSEELHHEMIAFRARVVASVRAETRLRIRAHPDPETLIGRVESLDSRLWERRRHHDDALRLAIGTGCVQWSPDLLTGYDAPAPEASRLVDEIGVLHDVPITVSFEPGSIVGLSGAPLVRRATTRPPPRSAGSLRRTSRSPSSRTTHICGTGRNGCRTCSWTRKQVGVASRHPRRRQARCSPPSGCERPLSSRRWDRHRMDLTRFWSSTSTTSPILHSRRPAKPSSEPLAEPVPCSHLPTRSPSCPRGAVSWWKSTQPGAPRCGFPTAASASTTSQCGKRHRRVRAMPPGFSPVSLIPTRRMPLPTSPNKCAWSTSSVCRTRRRRPSPLGGPETQVWIRGCLLE